MSESLKIAEQTRLKTATSLYDFNVASIVDMGKNIISLKHANANVAHSRNLISIVQTVHRLQRDGQRVSMQPQLKEFSQIIAPMVPENGLRSPKRKALSKSAS